MPHLKSLNLTAFGDELSAPVAYLRQGTLAAHSEEVFRLVGGSPVFFFLDPFGADGLSLDLVRRVLDLPRGEVFALFSHLGVARHLAVLSAETRLERVRRRVSESLFPDLKDEELAAELADAEESDASLLPTQAAAARILTELFGTREAVDEMLMLSRGSRGRAVVQEYVRTLRDECHASHITSLAMFDEDQAATYYLIHAAKNDQARYKMKEAIRGAMSASDLPEATKARIRWLHSAPIEGVVQQVQARFAGQAVRWTDKGDPSRTERDLHCARPTCPLIRRMNSRRGLSPTSRFRGLSRLRCRTERERYRVVVPRPTV